MGCVVNPDNKGGLLITIMNGPTQGKSRFISKNVTWDQRKRFAYDRFTLTLFSTKKEEHTDAAIALLHLKKLKEADPPDRRFHGLRHSFAVTPFVAGDELITAQEDPWAYQRGAYTGPIRGCGGKKRQASAQYQGTLITYTKENMIAK